MSHLSQSLYAFIPKGLLTSAERMTGENETNVTEAINSILPSIIKGILVSNASDHAAIGQLMNQAGGNDKLLTELNTDIQNSNRSSLGLNNGKHFIHVLFGQKTSGLVNLIANHSGVDPENAHLLLSIGGAVTASFLGKKMIGEALNFNGILTWINAHRAETELFLPQDFNSFLQDMNNNPFSSASERGKFPASTNLENVKNDGTKWLMPILLVGFLAFGIWYWLMGYNDKMPGTIEKVQIDSSMNHVADSAANMMKTIVDSTTNTTEMTVDTTTNSQDTLTR